MSEYWKSTPKYWCKHCSIYVKDTKFERTQHEATGKHQGNLKRALRDIHRGHERDERDKQRAKAEIDRLNRVVSGHPSTAPNTANEPQLSRKPATGSPAPTAKATPAERKRQLTQLADMGIAIPDEFRADMAMAGEWKTVSQQPTSSNVKSDEISASSVGVRKRRISRGEDEQDVGSKIGRKNWGSTVRMYPGSTSTTDADVEALLTRHQPIKADDVHDPGVKKVESTDDDHPKEEFKLENDSTQPGDFSHTDCSIKQENHETLVSPNHKVEAVGDVPQIIFKKRKSRATNKR